MKPMERVEELEEPCDGQPMSYWQEGHVSLRGNACLIDLELPVSLYTVDLVAGIGCKQQR